jgi:hypothetical protein
MLWEHEVVGSNPTAPTNRPIGDPGRPLRWRLCALAHAPSGALAHVLAAALRSTRLADLTQLPPDG